MTEEAALLQVGKTFPGVMLGEEKVWRSTRAAQPEPPASPSHSAGCGVPRAEDATNHPEKTTAFGNIGVPALAGAAGTPHPSSIRPFTQSSPATAPCSLLACQENGTDLIPPPFGLLMNIIAKLQPWKEKISPSPAGAGESEEEIVSAAPRSSKCALGQVLTMRLNLTLALAG